MRWTHFFILIIIICIYELIYKKNNWYKLAEITMYLSFSFRVCYINCQSQLSYYINTEVLCCAYADCQVLMVLKCVSAADSFNYKTFFKACGLASKTSEDVKKAFAIIDQDNSGFIEEDELK